MISGIWIQFQIWNFGLTQNLRVNLKLNQFVFDKDLSLLFHTLAFHKLLNKSTYEFEMISKWRFNYLNLKSQLKNIHNNKNESKVIKINHFIAQVLILTQGSFTRISYTRIKENTYKFELSYYKLKKFKEKPI